MSATVLGRRLQPINSTGGPGGLQTGYACVEGTSTKAGDMGDDHDAIGRAMAIPHRRHAPW